MKKREIKEAGNSKIVCLPQSLLASLVGLE